MNLEFTQCVKYYSFYANYATDGRNNEIEVRTRNRHLVDFDANLLHKDVDMMSAIATSIEYGITQFVVPGSNIEDSASALELSAVNEHILAATAGVHPYNTENTPLEESISALESMITSPLCRAVGECGLDYSQGFPDRAYQVPWFRTQVDLAIRHKKPLYLHERAASDDFIAILKEKLYDDGDLTGPTVPCVVHCFTSDMEALRTYVHMGCYIGLTGHIMSLSDEELRSVIATIPPSRLVVETDAPYMGFKGCRESETKKKGSRYPNVPAALVHIVRRIAENSDMSYDDIVSITTDNCFAFFGMNSK